MIRHHPTTLALALAALLTTPALSPATPPETLLCIPGDLLLEETFDPDTTSERWFFKGEFALRDGALVRTSIKPDEAQRVFYKDPEFHDAIVQFDFRFEGRTTDLRLVTGSGGGYNSVTQILRSHYQLNTPVDREAGYLPAHLGECPHEFQGGTWYTMTVEYLGDQMLAHLGGQHAILGSHPIIDRTRRYFAFQFDLPGAAIDNVRVWQAAGRAGDWEATARRLTRAQHVRPAVRRDPHDLYRWAETNTRSHLNLNDPEYNRLRQNHATLQAALKADYPEAFLSHKELGKQIAETKKKLKAENPKFKEMESAVHKARRAEDAYVMEQHPALASLPKRQLASELALARRQLEKKNDPALAGLAARSADLQAALEAAFPQAFASVDTLVDERKAKRKALNDDPEFKTRNKEVAAALHAIRTHELQAEPRLAELDAARKASE